MKPSLPHGATPVDSRSPLLNLEIQKGSGQGRSRPGLTAAVLTVLAAMGLAWYVLADAGRDPEEKSAQVIAAADQLGREADAEEAVDLAIKTISLSQGEGGFELWRLKAEWANLRKRDDLIIVERPRLTYNMREEGKVLFVESRTGDINQKQQLLRFIEDVRVTQEEKRIIGSLLVYNGGDKTMTFPQGCELTDTGVNGTMDTLVWHIDRQFIEGDGNVKVFLEGPEKNLPTYTSGPSSLPEAPGASENTP